MRVFLVEDSDDDASLFRLALEVSGSWTVVHATNLKDALDVAMSGASFDVVVVDPNLGDDNRVRTVRMVRRMFLGVPIVAMSGAPIEDQPEVSAEIIDRFLTKDILLQPEVLSSTLASIAMGEHRSSLETEFRDLMRTPESLDWLEGSVADGFWFWDLEGEQGLWVSQSMERALGWLEGTPQSEVWWQTQIHPDDLHMSLSKVSEHVRNPLKSYDILSRYKHREGHWIWFRSRARAIRDHEGKATRLLGMVTNVTEIMETSRELERRNVDLERTTYILSHDLRKPIRHMVGLVEIFIEDFGDVDNDEARDLISKLRRAGRRIEDLLDGILQFARLGEVSTWESVHLGAVVYDALEDYQQDIETMGIEVDVNVDAMLFGGRSMLYQLFSNLFGNAIKFRRPEVPLQLKVRGRQLDHSIVIEVSDNGVGIPEGQRTQAFQLFRRVGPAVNSTPGMGLGLAVCARIVEAHGGTIEALESLLGGTMIRVVIPANGRPVGKR